MAVVYITEFAEMPVPQLGIPMQVGKQPALTTQTVAITAGSVQSSAFNAGTKFVRVHTDAICSVLFGTNPTATATSPRMSAGQTEYYGVQPNTSIKVAVITNT